MQTETRTEFLARLRASFERTGRRNTAIGKHIVKVEAMNEEEYRAHRAALDARAQSPAVQASVARMASELLRKAR